MPSGHVAAAWPSLPSDEGAKRTYTHWPYEQFSGFEMPLCVRWLGEWPGGYEWLGLSSMVSSVEFLRHFGFVGHPSLIDVCAVPTNSMVVC